MSICNLQPIYKILIKILFFFCHPIKDTVKQPIVKSKHLQPKLVQVNEIIDELKVRKHATETSLNDALTSVDDETRKDSKHLFDQVKINLSIRGFGLMICI